MKQLFIQKFEQQLDQLEQEILAYEDEDRMWFTAAGITNTAGNLCFHLLGNLNHFIGKALGNTNYERDREFEFNVPYIERENLVAGIQTTKKMIATVLSGLQDLDAPYPEGFVSDPEAGSITKQLLRLQTHLAYHTGQINYHRRLLGKEVE